MSPLPHLAFGVLPETRRYRLRVARYPALVERIAEFVHDTPPDQPLDLLDIGVGRGRTLRFLEASQLEERLVLHGVDIAIRKDLYAPEAWRLKVSDVSRGLPYPDESMDVVVFEQVLEHLWDVVTPVREIERVLRPGGMLVLGVPTFPAPFAAIRDFTVKTFRRAHREGHSTHHQSFSRGSIVAHVERSTSLEVVDVRGFRVVSGGAIEFLEDHEWWYRASLRLAQALPWLCTEVQLVARKRPYQSASL
jgi:SAM-dependent methyltransferase